jgi:hypothetical protein
MNMKQAIVGWMGVAGWCACAGAFAAEAAQPTPSKDSEPFPITLRVTPALVLVSPPGATAPAGAPGATLTVGGETLPAGQRAVVVTIRSDGGADLGAMQVAPDAKGSYRLSAPAPTRAGVYQVTVVAPDGRGKARATFRAVDAGGVGESAEAVFAAALAAADEALPAVEAQIDAQVDSPAKDKARQKLVEVRHGLRELHEQPAGPAIRGVIGAISADAALQVREGPKLRALTQGLADAAAETERVRSLTSKLSGADLGCHQLAVVSEVFKAVSALFNLLKEKAVDIAQDIIKDVVADTLANKSKSRGTPAGVAFAGAQIFKNSDDQMQLAKKAMSNFPQIMADAGGFVTDTVFSVYCEQFSGPLDGIMHARFFVLGDGTAPPALWWSYNYKLSGRIVLYYPKSAKGKASIPLHGRLEGVAHSFDTWEDALPVMYPKLMAGASIRKRLFPPLDIGAAAARAVTQGAGPVAGYAQGSAEPASLPNSFLIGLQGVLEKDTLTVVIGPAHIDIMAMNNVMAVIAAPMVGGLGPQVTWYHLPFQKVRPFIVNATDAESFKLSLKVNGNNIEGQGAFTGKVDKPKAKGDYTLKVKACNPGC